MSVCEGHAHCNRVIIGLDDRAHLAEAQARVAEQRHADLIDAVQSLAEAGAAEPHTNPMDSAAAFQEIADLVNPPAHEQEQEGPEMEGPEMEGPPLTRHEYLLMEQHR